eukprot:CAMPEP_0197450548 /NCGR_PEP_ID=MMETSP1175-20131217/25735_1 /TAXON_ID=1003142 /ORGANISM="Triceratium dubium, Strain CCMP147" /LENGTH=60 /DNA_ID=CAMNT_0042982995 /DNA_START=11 /DNA_END=190 /DNA_ORIENTATION=+
MPARDICIICSRIAGSDIICDIWRTILGSLINASICATIWGLLANRGSLRIMLRTIGSCN